MMLAKSCSVLGVLLVASALVSGQQKQIGDDSGRASPAQAASPQAPLPPLQQRNPRYQIRSGDVLDVGFAFSPEFNQTVPVQPDGYITLRDVGDLHVAGMTVPDVREAIAKAYGSVLNRPEVTVQLKDFEKPYFIATGQVTKPGKYELRGDTRVTEAIAMAGGFNDSAKHSQVVLYRHVSPDWMKATVIDVKKMLAHNDLSEDLLVEPGDLIYVPQSSISKFRRYIPVPGIGMTVTPVP